MEWVSVFLGVFGMYQQTQVVLRVGLESGGDGNFLLSLQQFEQRLRELEVKIEQKFEFLFEKRLKGILIVEVEGGVVVRRLNGTPVCALPRGGVVDAHLFHDTHSALMNGGDDEVQHAVSVHDNSSVAVRLFLIPLLSLNGSVVCQQKGKILNRREIGRGKQVTVHR